MAHRQRRHLGGGEVVEACDRDRIIGATDLLDIAMAEGGDAARLAEDMMRAVRSELIVGERRGIGQQAEGVGLDLRAPVPFLGADRAIALARPRFEIEVGFELDRAAVARTMVGLEHLLFSGWQRDPSRPSPEAM